jgi:hypothetical protein
MEEQMKVKYKYNLQGYRGKIDGLIYYIDKHSGRSLARSEFKFKNHPAHTPFREAQQHIYALAPSAEYKLNLYDYCMGYNALPEAEYKKLYSWCHVYNKLMWAMQKAMPDEVDLKTITREQIIAESLPCKTLKDAIDAGLLPKVKGFERFDALI